MNGKTQVLNGVFEKTRAEIVNPAGKFAIFSSKRFAIRNFRDSKAVYKEVNRMKTPVRCMDCELDSHLFWTKRSHTRWIRHLPGEPFGQTSGQIKEYKSAFTWKQPVPEFREELAAASGKDARINLTKFGSYITLLDKRKGITRARRLKKEV